MAESPDAFPVDMVHVRTGKEFAAESLLQFNRLATSGYRVKNKEKKDEVAPSVTVASSPVVSDPQPVDSNAGENPAASSEDAATRPNLRRNR